MQRANQDYRDPQASQENQEVLGGMAPGAILEILDRGESLDHLGQRATKDGQALTTLDHAEPLETEATKGDEDREGAEVTAAPRGNLERKADRAALESLVGRESQERGDPEATPDPMVPPGRRAIPDSLTVMS